MRTLIGFDRALRWQGVACIASVDKATTAAQHKDACHTEISKIVPLIE
jgi:hypothetical protein